MLAYLLQKIFINQLRFSNKMTYYVYRFVNIYKTKDKFFYLRL